MDTANKELARRVLVPYHTALSSNRDIYYYAESVVRGRWYQGERELAKALPQKSGPYWVYCYLLDIAKVRIPELEPCIISNAAYCVSYARAIIEGRWPEAEPLIMKSQYSKNYVAEVIKGNWAYEGEEMWWLLSSKN